MDLPPDTPIVLDSHDQALQLLISRTVPQNELASLIETIFSNKKVTDVVDCLRGGEVQTFIDVIDEVRHHTHPSQSYRLIYPNVLYFVG
jgi:hypothetical protein